MDFIDTVRSILKSKGRNIWDISPEKSVYDAVSTMADKHVGALLVISKGDLVGIVTERDYARKVILQGKSSKETQVKQIMTTPAICVTPDETVQKCMAIMTNKHIRHLPVVEDGKVLGIVSIGDLVKSVISAQEQTIAELHDYISNKYPG